ncbi:MAG TPA: MFS transporter [Dehalococcoidia bacterium]|nr:MFS transporter [Dehalococcoidia bacterium]
MSVLERAAAWALTLGAVTGARAAAGRARGVVAAGLGALDRASQRAMGLDDAPAARLVSLAALGVFFAADDQTSVVAVLPKMIEGVGLPQDQFFRAAWIVNGYILGYVVAMPLMGRVSDVFGHGRVFAAAMGLFVLGSAWVAVSPALADLPPFPWLGLSDDLTMLALARGVQAVGGGAVVPVAMAIVADTMPLARRAYGLGAMAAASEAGGLVGPAWGGSVAQLLGWQGVFWVNVPMCLPIAAGTWGLARLSGPARRRGRIDLTGAALLGASLVCLTVALTDDPIEPRAGGATAALYGAAAVLFAAFVAQQRAARAPLVELGLFRRLPLAAAFLTNGLVGGALIVAMVNVPLFTNVILNGTAIEGGLNLMRLTVALPLGALAGGYVATRAGLAPTAAAAVVLAGVGFLGMSRWGESPGDVAFTAPLLIAGLGLGLVIAPVNTAALDQVEEGQRATVSSLLTVVRLIGALVGVALLTTRGLGGFYAEAGLIPLDEPKYIELLVSLEVDAFQDTFRVTGLVCMATALPALLLGWRRRRQAG